MSDVMAKSKLKRSTIRLTSIQKHRIQELVRLGEYMTEAEAIRSAISHGLDHLEKQINIYVHGKEQ